MRKLFCILTALLVFASCNKEEQLLEKMNFEAPVFTSSFEDYDLEGKTKTYVDGNVRLLWHEADELSVFTTTLNQKYIFDGETGENSGTFTKVSSEQFGTGNDIDRNYAVYPYISTNKLSNSEVLTVTLPATQDYAVNSFGRGANTMVAVTSGLNDYFLPFKNVGGYLVIKLYGDDVTVSSVELKGNNGEKLSGKAEVVAKYGQSPAVEMAETATEVVTIDCGEEGVKLGATQETPTQFWFVVPPTVFEKGFTVTITDAVGGVMEQTTSRKYGIERNTVSSMSAFEVETNDRFVAVPTNEIWYTSTDGEIVEPKNTEGFGANIVSNTYENGKGVIKFDGEVTSVGDEAFMDCDNLKSINLPESITSIIAWAFLWVYRRTCCK